MVFAFVLAATLANGHLQENQIRSLLKSQGFIAPLEGSEIKYAGSVRQGKGHYDVYYYRYIFPQNQRGIGRLIITLNENIFVGSYPVDTTYNCGVERRAIVCDTWLGPGWGTHIEFTDDGPPQDGHIDGMPITIDYGTRMRRPHQ